MTATDLESTAATRQFGVEGGSSILENDALDDNITEHRYKIGPDLAAFAGPGQTVGVPQGLYFRNKDGGTIWSWGFPADEILVRCGDNQVFKSHHIVSDVDVSWFEVWKKVGHRFSGTLYQC